MRHQQVSDLVRTLDEEAEPDQREDRRQADQPPLQPKNTDQQNRGERRENGAVAEVEPVVVDSAIAGMVGETVVYPHHGAATIIEVKDRIIKGETKKYLKLNVTQGDLIIEVPADNVDLVGVRDVIGKDGLERVFDVLRAAFTEEPTNWSRRYKANLEKLASGDVIKVSEVVRDLWRRDQDRGLSAGEKRMLAKARQILVSELALAEKIDEDKAGALLDEVLAS